MTSTDSKIDDLATENKETAAIKHLLNSATSASPSTNPNSLSMVSFPLLLEACQWAVDNLIKPETDQVILLNARPFERMNYKELIDSASLLLEVSRSGKKRF
jgi:hypothetical protein